MEVMSERKAWEVLGIRPGASEELIQAAFRKRAKELHPDVGGTREEWDELQAAYTRLMIDDSHGYAEAYPNRERKAYWKWRGLPRLPRVLVVFVVGGALLVAGGWALISWYVSMGFDWRDAAGLMLLPAAGWVWQMVAEARRHAIRHRKTWFWVTLPTDPDKLKAFIQHMEDQEQKRTASS